MVVGSSPTVGVFCVASASPCRIQTELWLQLAMFAQSAFILQHIIEEQGLQAKIRFMVVCCSWKSEFDSFRDKTDPGEMHAL